jgi:hypothetical protein
LWHRRLARKKTNSTVGEVFFSGLECGVFTPLLFGLFLSGLRQCFVLPQSKDKAEKQKSAEQSTAAVQRQCRKTKAA